MRPERSCRRHSKGAVDRLPAAQQVTCESYDKRDGTIDGRGSAIVGAANYRQDRTSEDEKFVSATTDATAAVRFALGGMLRFLSHAETLGVFQRACARAGVAVKFTEGFNPHPKVSLPLPRPVGVASEDELLVLRLFEEQGFPFGEAPSPARRQWQDRLGQSLAEVLPGPIRVRSVTLEKSHASFVAESADYVFNVRSTEGSDVEARWPQRIAAILARESIVVERISPNRPRRLIDVRGFLKSIRMEGDCIVATCVISAGGSIRVDEIMELLGLTAADLAAPIRRMNVAWKTT